MKNTPNKKGRVLKIIISLDVTIKDTNNSLNAAQQETFDNEFYPNQPRHISEILPECLARLKPKGGEYE